MVIQGDDLRRVGFLVDVEGGEVEVGEPNGGAALDQGEDADGLAAEGSISVVVGLVVDYDAGEARRRDSSHLRLGVCVWRQQ